MDKPKEGYDLQQVKYISDRINRCLQLMQEGKPHDDIMLMVNVYHTKVAKLVNKQHE